MRVLRGPRADQSQRNVQGAASTAHCASRRFPRPRRSPPDFRASRSLAHLVGVTASRRLAHASDRSAKGSRALRTTPRSTKRGNTQRRLAAESPIHGFGVQRAPAPHHQGAIPFLTSFARASPRFASRRLGRSADLPRAAREARGSRWRYARSSFTLTAKPPPHPARARLR